MTPTSPSRSDLLAAVERVRPLAESHACDGERARALHPAVSGAMREAGLFALAAPKALGGFEADVETQLAVYEAMARADGAAGWCLMIGALSSAMLGAYLPDACVKSAFSAGVPVTAGLQMPFGKARRTGHGYCVDGRWAFGSGIRHADWIFTPAMIEGGDGAGPPMVSVAVPVSKVVVESTWDVSGLRGTGSEHYRMEGVEVELDHTCVFPHAAPRRGGTIFRLPFLAYVTVGHIGFALGVAKRALDEITAAAPKRVKLSTQRPMAEHPHFRLELGRAHAKLASARAWSVDVLGAMAAEIAQGNALASATWRDVRCATAFVTDVAAEVVTFAYRAGGAFALGQQNPLQRCWRDVHAATQHVAANEDAYELAGSILLGEPFDHPLAMPRMVAPM